MAQNYITITESETPYTINSFFRTSEENPFAGAQNPTIVVKLNGTSAVEDPQTPVASHKLSCTATYTQENFVQWKSYQWSITSSDGKTIYDQTPVGYDNEIKADFYGLKGGVSYNIVLVIETNDSRVITKTFPISCTAQENVGTPVWLTAETDTNGYYSCSEEGDTGSNCVAIYAGFPVDIYRCEVWPTGEEEYYHLVAQNCVETKDYNVANHRWYKYLARSSANPGSGTAEDPGTVGIIPVHTCWAGWTLTELVPSSNPVAHYHTSVAYPTGVWKFKYNVSAGARTHNLSKTPHDTLSRFPYFSFGETDFESGSVTCLLGREIIPYNLSPQTEHYYYDNVSHSWKWDIGEGRGGYTERLPNKQNGFRDLTSNEKINMLDAWRRFCFSGNPKLLKDEKGNSYIVQILNTTSETLNNVYGRPEQISFEWQQTGDVKNWIVLSGENDVVHHYTVRWDKTTAGMTRLNDAALFTTDTANFVHRGSVNPNYNNPFDDIYPWRGRKLCQINGFAYRRREVGDPLIKFVSHWEGDRGFEWGQSYGVWVYTPEFWGKSWDEGDYRYFDISDKPVEGYVYYPERIEGRWHGADAVNGLGVHWLLPRTNSTPAVSLPLATLEKYSRNFGDSTLDTIQSVDANNLLFVVEYASMNSQLVIGLGNVNRTTGATVYANSADVEIGSKSGYLGDNGLNFVYYRGEELWGNAFFYILGVSCLPNRTVKIKDQITDIVLAEQATGQGANWIRSLGTVDGLSVPPFCTAVGGTNAYPVGDWYVATNQSLEETAMVLGGHLRSGQQAGAFYANWQQPLTSLGASVLSARPCLTVKTS